MDFDVHFMHGDITDAATIKEALKDTDLVVHLAADTRVVDSIAAPQWNFCTNVYGTFNLLCRMKEVGIRRIVNTSTGGAILGEVPPVLAKKRASCYPYLSV